MYDLDGLDYKILALLKDDARASSREIAGTLGVAESTVRKRVNQLTDSGAVRFTAVTNTAALGQLIAFVGIHTDWQRVHAVVRALVAIEEVMFVAVTLGPFDIIATVNVTSHDELVHLLTERIGEVRGVRRTETSHWLRGVKYDYQWAVFPDEIQPPRRRTRKGGPR